MVLLQQFALSQSHGVQHWQPACSSCFKRHNAVQHGADGIVDRFFKPMMIDKMKACQVEHWKWPKALCRGKTKPAAAAAGTTVVQQ
jgi:hypothetical protein